MSPAPGGPWALIELVLAGPQAVFVAVDRTTPCDLDLVERLLWLRVRVRRLGWTIRLVEVDDELRDLLDFAGVLACFGVSDSC